MTKSKTLIFFGNERIVTGLQTTAPTLQALIKAGYTIAAVVIAQKDIQSSRKTNTIEVGEIAKKHGIPLLAPNKLTDIKDDLISLTPAAGVLVAYGKIIPQAIIDIFPHGIINIHPSLLPKHRGSTPIESAILDGDTNTGVSIMQISSAMDAGPVYAQKIVLLNGDEQKQDLANKLLTIGKDLVIENLPAIIDGSLKPTQQDEEAATYDNLIEKSMGIIDTNKSAEVLEREIRAFSDWPKSRIKLGSIDVIVTTAVVVDSNLKPGEISTDNDEILAGTKAGALKIVELMPLGKKNMPAKAFLNGYKNRIYSNI